jgi:hypothetical protein
MALLGQLELLSARYRLDGLAVLRRLAERSVIDRVR